MNHALSIVIAAGLSCLALLYWPAWKRLRPQGESDPHTAYGMAADMAAESLYVFSPCRNDEGVIRDWTVVRCNARGAACFGLEKQQMQGMALSELLSGPALDSLLGACAVAQNGGSYEDECEQAFGAASAPICLRRRFVRCGDSLAAAFQDISSDKAEALHRIRLENEDPVTLLPNRNWLIGHLGERLRAPACEAALLFIDLDDFKNINDTLGHAVGDLLLRATALRIKSVLGENDRVARLGGDEFAIVLADPKNRADALRVADLVLEIVRFPLQLPTGRGSITASVGVGMFPGDADDADGLLKTAEIAMYAAKENGKARRLAYDASQYQRLKSRLSLEHDLEKAIERDEFVLYFEPRMRIDSGRYSGLEALVRWVHPERGLVPPADFIPFAESTGQILRLGELIIDKAFRQIAFWQQSGCAPVPVSINISARQFNNGNLGKTILGAFEKYGVPPALVEIELTESAMLGDPEAISREFAGIRAQGVRVLIDDFGTGYSSLAQLRRMKMDTLKIDRAFLSDLDHSDEEEVFVKAIISMAHALGMSVVAEGVEREAQLHILRSLCCDEIQGYYLSPPMPAHAVPHFLADCDAPGGEAP